MRATGKDLRTSGQRSGRTRNTRALFVALLSSLAVGACTQPKVKCSVARGTFAARYTLIEGEGDCASLTGELLGVQAYNERTSATNSRPNYEKSSIGIEPLALSGLLSGSAGLVEPNADDLPYGLGKFTTAEPKSEECVVPSLTTARVRLPVIPEQVVDECNTTPEQPAVDVEYVFDNVRIINSPEHYGTKLEATLTYTNNGCTAKYAVAAVYPAKPCDVAVYPEPVETPIEMDDNGDPICPSPAEPVEPIPSDDQCSPAAIPERGIATGSGISADFPVVCDPVLLFCLLK